MSAVLGTVLVVAAVLEGWLLFSGNRILLRERMVRPGETYIVEGFGNLGTSQQASLVCTYFTGRSQTTAVFWYSPNNILGRDGCPFIHWP